MDVGKFVEDFNNIFNSRKNVWIIVEKVRPMPGIDTDVDLPEDNFSNCAVRAGLDEGELVILVETKMTPMPLNGFSDDTTIHWPKGTGVPFVILTTPDGLDVNGVQRQMKIWSK